MCGEEQNIVLNTTLNVKRRIDILHSCILMFFYMASEIRFLSAIEQTF